MPIYVNPKERNVIRQLLKEMKEYYRDIENEHLVDMVAFEATHHGIHPAISTPFARTLLDKI